MEIFTFCKWQSAKHGRMIIIPSSDRMIYLIDTDDSDARKRREKSALKVVLNVRKSQARRRGKCHYH